jgi:hypothetical protein
MLNLIHRAEEVTILIGVVEVVGKTITITTTTTTTIITEAAGMVIVAVITTNLEEGVPLKRGQK